MDNIAQLPFILNRLSDTQLEKACFLSPEAREICNDEEFWRNRYIDRFGQPLLTPEISWKRLYHQVVYCNPRGITINRLINTQNYVKLQELIQLGLDTCVYRISFNYLLATNRLDLLEDLANRGLFDPYDFLVPVTQVIRLGRLNFLDWLARYNIYPPPITIRQAFQSNDPAIIDWFYRHGYEINPYIIQINQHNTSPEVQQWLQEHDFLSPARYATQIKWTTREVTLR